MLLYLLLPSLATTTLGLIPAGSKLLHVMKGASVYVWKVMMDIGKHTLWFIKFKVNTFEHQPIEEPL